MAQSSAILKSLCHWWSGRTKSSLSRRCALVGSSNGLRYCSCSSASGRLAARRLRRRAGQWSGLAAPSVLAASYATTFFTVTLTALRSIFKRSRTRSCDSQGSTENNAAEIKISSARDPPSLGPNGISSDLCLCGRQWSRCASGCWRAPPLFSEKTT